MIENELLQTIAHDAAVGVLARVATSNTCAHITQARCPCVNMSYECDLRAMERACGRITPAMFKDKASKLV
jgi:hypothetical protein